MKDLITEVRELIEALHAGVYDDEYIGTGAYLMLDELCDALEKYRWIPVTERLPKTEKPVQVYMPKLHMSVQTGFYTRYYGEDDGEWYEHWVASGDVTHWRPLPAPPAKEQSVKEIERAIKHFESLQKRYTTTHNRKHCELVKTALTALREQAEREKGCEFCSCSEYLDNTLYPKEGYIFYAGYSKQIAADDFHEYETEEIKFCPMCGKRLEVEHEVD